MGSDIQLNNSFSVVIPTLGGDALARTIAFINSGTVKPNEILICIPKDFAKRVESLAVIENVKIIATESKGQVKQRVEGFGYVQNEYVIQLDDDMFVHKTCFERLLEAMAEIGGDIAIAPAMIFEPGGNSCYDMVHMDSRMMTLIHGKNWFTPGTITRTGMNIGLNALTATKRYNKVEWLPGGCVLHKKKNLVRSDFFPFKGKAFYEDVIQSIHLTRKGVKLYIDRLAVCGIDPYDPLPATIFQPITIFKQYFPYRKHVVKLRNQPIIYLLLDGLFTYYQTYRSLLKQQLNVVFGKKR